MSDTEVRQFDIVQAGRRLRSWTGGEGPVLLLLHSAWGDASLSWALVWNELCRSFTVLAPDLPGFGGSDPLAEPSLSAYAQMLKELLDSRKTERAIVVGNSFGAALAIEFAAAYPERTRRLVLVNGGFLPVLPGWVNKLLGLPFLEKRLRKLMRSMNYSDKAFARAFPDHEKLPHAFLERIRSNEEKQARNVFDTFRNQVKRQEIPAVPVAIIWGAGDRLVTIKQAGLLCNWPFQPQNVSIPGAGHLPQVDASTEFVQALKKIAATL